MFLPMYPTEQVLKKHISYRAVLQRSVFMDTASVPGSGEVLVVRCLGLFSPERGKGSAVSPRSAEEVGPRQSQLLARDAAVGQGHGHPSLAPGRLFPQQSAVASHLSKPLTCPPASLWDLPQQAPSPGPP